MQKREAYAKQEFEYAGGEVNNEHFVGIFRNYMELWTSLCEHLDNEDVGIKIFQYGL